MPRARRRPCRSSTSERFLNTGSSVSGDVGFEVECSVVCGSKAELVIAASTYSRIRDDLRLSPEKPSIGLAFHTCARLQDARFGLLVSAAY